MPDKDVRSVPVDVLEAAQRIWLAGLGAMALAQEEGTKLVGGTARLFSVLIEKGREMEWGGPSAASVVKRAKKVPAETAEDVWSRLQSMLDAQVESALQRLGVPTRKDVLELAARIDTLTRSIDKLRARG